MSWALDELARVTTADPHHPMSVDLHDFLIGACRPGAGRSLLSGAAAECHRSA
jgi:hypothetical protein